MAVEWLCTARTMLIAVKAEDFGLSGRALLEILKVKLPKTPLASISCMLVAIPGSAINSTCVSSNLKPASATEAATLAFLGY